MAKQVINVGSAPNSGGGDPLRDAMIKINENFTEVYDDIADLNDGIIVSSIEDTQGNVLVDATAGTISASALTGSVAGNLIDFTVDGTPDTLDGHGITDAYTKLQVYTKEEIDDLVDTGIKDIQGSVFADDSTLLVDGVNGKITGVVDTTEVTSPLLTLSPDTFVSVDNVGDLSNEAITIRTIDSTGILYGSRQGTSLGGKGAGTNFIYDDDGTYRAGLMRPDVIRNAGKIPKLILDANWVRNELNNTMQAYSSGDSVIDIKADTINLQGVVTINQGVEEAFDTLTGATGTVAHDCDNGHIFYHTTPAADWTANFTNLGLTAEHATTLSIVIAQGATAYIPSAVEIGGVAQTLLWQGGSAPSGTANGTDVVAFSILNDGGTYVVMGQLVGFS